MMLLAFFAIPALKLGTVFVSDATRGAQRTSLAAGEKRRSQPRYMTARSLRIADSADPWR